MILTRKEKEDLVIELANQGKSTRYIAQVVHISLKDIGTIIRRYTGEEDVAPTESQDKTLSLTSKAFKLFKDNKSLVDVAIALNMEADEVLCLHSDYLQLSNKDKLMSIYRETGDDIHQLAYLYNELKWHGLANRKDIYNIVQHSEKLKSLDKVVFDAYGEIGRLDSTKLNLEAEVKELQKKIDHYDSMLLEREQHDSSFNNEQN